MKNKILNWLVASLFAIAFVFATGSAAQAHCYKRCYWHHGHKVCYKTCHHHHHWYRYR